MNWIRSNIKEIAVLVPLIGSGLGYGGNLTYNMIYENGYNKGTIDTRDAFRPKLDSANTRYNELNAKYNHDAGVAAGWKLLLDDC